MRGLVVPIVAALLLVAPAARADVTEAAAQGHLDRGVAAFRKGDYVRAHLELEAAHELVPDKPNPYRWLALTEVQLGDCSRALANIDAFLARVPAADPRVAEVVRLRELCQRTGAVTVRSTPPSATLRIDGAIVGTTPFRSLSMRTGAHTASAEKPGYEVASHAFDLQPGATLDFELRLARTPTAVTGRWWFWPAVVGAALAVTGAVVLVTRDDGATILPPIVCDATGCHPVGS